MRISIVGLGLIGGSMAIDLRKRNFASHIIGVDASKLHAQSALNLGLVDEILSLEQAVADTELIILAVPANATLPLLQTVLNQVDNQVVTDVSSVKEDICKQIKNHSKRKNFVAAHPMAGTERSGPWAAFSGLYEGKAVIFCDCEDSSEQAISLVTEMYDSLGMRTIDMNSCDHDVHAAYVSHISHISSYALALTVLDKEKNERNIFDLASGGFDSTVRLAKSHAAMWTPIFDHNSKNVITVLDTYIEQLNLFKAAIEENNIEKINHLIDKANRIKKVL